MTHKSSHIIIEMRRRLDALEKETAELRKLLEELETSE